MYLFILFKNNNKNIANIKCCWWGQKWFNVFVIIIQFTHSSQVVTTREHGLSCFSNFLQDKDQKIHSQIVIIYIEQGAAADLKLCCCIVIIINIDNNYEL